MAKYLSTLIIPTTTDETTASTDKANIKIQRVPNGLWPGINGFKFANGESKVKNKQVIAAYRNFREFVS
jgi:hypothetical protein